MKAYKYMCSMCGCTTITLALVGLQNRSVCEKCGKIVDGEYDYICVEINN